MSAPTLGGVPPTARRRLVDHYGPAVDSWLDAVRGLVTEAASRWGLTLVNYHDAGCASSIAVARTPGGRSVLVKAWYERNRYTHEIVALRTWHGRQVPKVVHQADDLAIAALEVVGGQPGGAIRPPGELEAVALGLAGLHAIHGPGSPFPRLDEYLNTVVRPRIGRRLHAVGGDIPPESIEGLRVPDPYVRSDTLLHADLYRENVLFDVNRRPVFVDPLPMVGDPVFDWAFWVVYYDLLRDPVPRLRLASAIGGIPQAELVSWCLCLCVDGLLLPIKTIDDHATIFDSWMGVLSRLGLHARHIELFGNLRVWQRGPVEGITLRYRHAGLELGDIVLLWNARDPSYMVADLGTGLERLRWKISRWAWLDVVHGRLAHGVDPDVLDALRTAVLLIGSGITRAAHGPGSAVRRLLRLIPQDIAPLGLSTAVREFHSYWL